METLSCSLLSAVPARFGRNALVPGSKRQWSAPPLVKRRGKRRAAVIPLLLQVHAKASSSKEQNFCSFPVQETEGVRIPHEEICDKGVGGHLVAAGVSIAAAFVVAFSHVGLASARPGDVDLPPIEPEVATVSSSKEINLAKQLKAIGAKMYGAFWCSHCFEQKQMFGKEALKYIQYVECYPDGYRRGVKLAAACSAADIQGFPTWVINGQKYSGEQEFDKLAALSGFPVSQVKK